MADGARRAGRRRGDRGARGPRGSAGAGAGRLDAPIPRRARVGRGGPGRRQSAVSVARASCRCSTRRRCGRSSSAGTRRGCPPMPSRRRSRGTTRPFLRGEVAGEDVLFAPRRLRLWVDYFSNDNGLYAVNNRVGAVAVADWLPGPGSSILELGGGLASGALALLAELEARDRLRDVRGYRFTEPVSAFLRRGEQTLRDRYPALAGLSFGALDMNQGFGEQGVAPASVSVVYAVNTLHAARDLGFTLRGGAPGAVARRPARHLRMRATARAHLCGLRLQSDGGVSRLRGSIRGIVPAAGSSASKTGRRSWRRRDSRTSASCPTSRPSASRCPIGASRPSAACVPAESGDETVC